MAVMIVGTGHQKSIRTVIALLDLQIREKSGIPRKITARGENIEVVAERADFKTEFTTFRLKVHLRPDQIDAFTKAVEAGDGACRVIEEDGWQVVECLAAPADANAQAIETAIDRISSVVSLPEVWRAIGDRFRADRISVERLFQAMVQYKASDVHLAPSFPPVFRVDNKTHMSDIMPPLSSMQIRALVHELASEKDWQVFEESKQTSFSFHQVGIGYSRVSAFIKSGVTHCTMRFLPEEIPSFDDLHIPPATMTQLASLARGLLLVTGMTGSGKTTTAAALVDWINTNRALHILTIENPVEYVHHNKKSIVSQRTLGEDVDSFHEAVTGALRHDPDVIVIGEMRDPDTIRSAINAAATGHLVISTLHSNSASEVVNRIVSFFDPIERDLVRLQLRDSLRCVMCQRLVPRKEGGRTPALEIMFNDIKAINDAIIAGDTDGIRVGMQQSVSHSFLFEEDILRLYKDGAIDLDNAREFATDVSTFDQMLMGTYSIPRLDSLKALR
jgi:twitching motility protein PilT